MPLRPSHRPIDNRSKRINTDSEHVLEKHGDRAKSRPTDVARLGGITRGSGLGGVIFIYLPRSLEHLRHVVDVVHRNIVRKVVKANAVKTHKHHIIGLRPYAAAEITAVGIVQRMIGAQGGVMRTTHVIRGDEWISSVPKHLQLFKTLGFKPPKYAHVSPIMVEDNGNKRKLSKRKDPQAAMHFYAQQGYPADSVLEYLLTIANSDFEDWRRRNQTAHRSEFKFNLKKMSVSGALFDLVKLNDVSKTTIARMDAQTVTDKVIAWAEEYDEAFADLLKRDMDYTLRIFSIDRGNAKPRKDIAKWSEVPEYISFFFKETYQNTLELPENIAPADAAAVLTKYADVYNPAEDKDTWFATVKSICENLGFCPDVKQYKADPTAWKGHVGDVSSIIRIAMTGRRNTPDLCSIMQTLGTDEVKARLQTAIDAFSK